MAVELKEYIEGPTALGLIEGVRVVVQNIEEVVDRGVKGTGLEDVAVEEKAKTTGALAMVEVRANEAPGSVGLDEKKGLLDATAVRVKDIFQEKKIGLGSFVVVLGVYG